MTSLKTSIKTITYLSDTGCLEIQGASLVLEAIMLDSNRTESYLLHVKEYLEKRFDKHMEEAGKRERLIYVDMDKVMHEMRYVHTQALLFSMS